MLANVVILAVLLVDVGLALEAAIRHVLLVVAPRDALVLEQVDDGGYVLDYLGEVIVLHPEVVTTDGRDVVGLRRVRDGVVVGERDAMLGYPG